MLCSQTGIKRESKEGGGGGGQSWSKSLMSIVPLSSVKTWKAAVISKSGYSVSTTRTAKLVHAIILLRQRWTISGPVPDAHPMRCSSPLAVNQIHSCLIVASASAVKPAYRCARPNCTRTGTVGMGGCCNVLLFVWRLSLMTH